MEHSETHSQLLLYLADELAEADRRQMEQRLAADPALAAECARLESLQAEIHQHLAALDRLDAPAVEVDRVARQIGREFRQRSARSPLRITPAPTRSGIGRRMWLGGAVAAAAAVALTVLIQVQHRTAAPRQVATTVPAPAVAPSNADDPQADVSLALLENSYDSPASELADSSAGARRGTVPQDEISQYLLNVEAGRQ